MPKVMIINIPMMYHCVLQVQSMSLMSAASTAFILCIAMFVTKVFSLDCLYNTYIMISMINQCYKCGCEYKYIGYKTV